MWTLGESNSSPPECKTGALPYELRALVIFSYLAQISEHCFLYTFLYSKKDDIYTTIFEIIRKGEILKFISVLISSYFVYSRLYEDN